MTLQTFTNRVIWMRSGEAAFSCTRYRGHRRFPIRLPRWSSCDRFEIDIFVSSTCILNIITLVPSIVLFAPSLSVGSGARVFVAKSDPFCALQACMDGSR